MIKAERYTNLPLSKAGLQQLCQDLGNDGLRYAAAQRLSQEVRKGSLQVTELEPYEHEICKLMSLNFEDIQKTKVALDLLSDKVKEAYLVVIADNKNSPPELRINSNFKSQNPDTNLAQEFQKNYGSLKFNEKKELLAGLAAHKELITEDFLKSVLKSEKNAELRVKIIDLIKDDAPALNQVLGIFCTTGEFNTEMISKFNERFSQHGKQPQEFLSWLKKIRTSTKILETIRLCDSILTTNNVVIQNPERVCKLAFPKLYEKNNYISHDLDRDFIVNLEKITAPGNSELEFNHENCQRLIAKKDSVKIDGVIVFAKKELDLQNVELDQLYADPKGVFKYCYYIPTRADSEANVAMKITGSENKEATKLFENMANAVISHLFVGQQTIYETEFKGSFNNCLIFDVDKKSYIIRFSKTNTLERERKNMQLAKDAGISVPTIYREGKIGEHYFQIQEFLPGKTLVGTKDQIFGNYYELGQQLSTLHKIQQPVGTETIDLKRELAKHLISCSRIPKVKKLMLETNVTVQELLKMVDSCEKTAPVLMHRDLHKSNMMRSPQGELSIIDWGLSGFCEYPIADISRATPYNNFEREQLLAGYGNESPNLKHDLAIFSLFRLFQLVAIQAENNLETSASEKEIRSNLDFLRK